MSRNMHKSYYLVEGLRKTRNGQVKSFHKYIFAASAKEAKSRVKGYNIVVYRMDNSFKP